MPVTIATGTITSTGVQDITGSLGGATPFAVIMKTIGVASNEADGGDAALAVGFATASAEGGSSFLAEDAVSTSNTDRETSSSTFITAPNDIGFNSFKANGMEVNVPTLSASFFYKAIFFYGSGGAAAVGTDVVSTTEQTLSGLSFEPDLLFITGTGNASITASTNAIYHFGVAKNGGNQLGVSYFNRNALATTQTESLLRTADVAGQSFAGSQTWNLDITGFTSDGFTHQATASAGLDIVNYLAIKLPTGESGHVGKITLPASGSTYSETGFGFEPSFAEIITPFNTTANDNALVADGVLAFGAFDGTTEKSCGVWSKDGAGTSNERDFAASKALWIQDDTGSEAIDLSFSSFDSDGFTLTVNTAASSARSGLVWAVGSSGGGGGSILPIILAHDHFNGGLAA